MNLPPVLRHSAHLLRHFASTRSVEVLALQASPLLGVFLGGYRIGRDDFLPFALLLLGSAALTAHIFIFNDWAGYEGDLRDPRRAPNVFSRYGIARHGVLLLSLALLLIAAVALAAVGSRALLIGVAIAGFGFVYSASPVFGKSMPIAASLNHLVGGALHFLLGYTLSHALDAHGVWIAAFFGLVFAGGHLNQEVRDYDGDLLNGIRTNAVAFGRRRTFLASLFTFTAAYAMLTVLAALGLLPKLLLWSPLAWLLHLAWSLRALRHGLGFETALWVQRRYRALFALIGLAILIGTF